MLLPKIEPIVNNTKLEKVTLGEGLKVIPSYAFDGCEKLTLINLENVEIIGTQAFAETSVLMLDLSNCLNVGPYAFINCDNLLAIKLNENGTDIEEGAFGNCTMLGMVENLDKVERIDEYGFAYIALNNFDLSSAIEIGDFAFIKENVTDITVKLSDKIVVLGDNPFAMCKVAPFATEVTEEFNGVAYTETVYTFDISETVKVINGSLYCKVPSGLELITYCDNGDRIATVEEGTVRVTAMAFAGSDVVRVDLPHSLNAIGHKAFYDCDKLVTVIFKSYEAPILEEEFDQGYYLSFENLPATGEYEFTDYEGNIIKHTGLGIVPYYMWNVSDGKYSNAYYGANFVYQIGHGNPELIMIRPSNGQHYETFIYSQYFTTIIDGAVAMDDITLEAIEAINRLPERVQLSHESLVIAAREAYDKIATKEQQAFVTNYTSLVSAENRILALKSNQGTSTPDAPDVEDPTPNQPDVVEKKVNGYLVATIVLSITTAIGVVASVVAIATSAVAVALAAVVVLLVLKLKKPSLKSPKKADVKAEAKASDKKTEENK